MIWQAKTTANGQYVDMKTPSSYKIDYEDLDANSYRSITTGNLIDTRVSASWSKIQMSFNFATKQEAQQLLPILQANPLYVRAENPIFGSDFVEMQMRCSKKSIEKLEAGLGYRLSFNLVQKKKVNGQ